MSVSAFFILPHKAGLEHLVIYVLVSPLCPGSLAVDGSYCCTSSQQQLDEASQRPALQHMGEP